MPSVSCRDVHAWVSFFVDLIGCVHSLIHCVAEMSLVLGVPGCKVGFFKCKEG